jgi:restriction endonuclease S subunit
MGASESLGTFVSLIRGTTYKGALVGAPGPALLGLGAITPGGGFREGDFKTYGGDCPEKLLLGPGDLFVSLKGATKDGEMIGSVARVPASVSSGRLTQDTVKLDFKSGSMAFRSYIYWLLRTPHYRQYCAARATGSAVVALSREDFLAYEVPPLDTARGALVTLFDAVEEKIRLNRRMCQTLEEMARALFKSWFVDFDPVRAKMQGRDSGLPKEIANLFPSRLVDSALGPIPEGWRVMKLGAMAKIEKGLSYKGAGLTESGGVPMINLGCFGGDGLFRADKLKHYSAEYQPRHLARCGDLLVANTDMTQDRIILGSPMLVPPSLGRADSLFTHHVFALRFMPEWERYSLYCYYALLQPAFRNIAAGFATGTTVLALPRDGMEQFPIATPDDRTTAAFIDLVAPLRARQDATRAESLILDQLRDTLLPKLISGELRVPASLGTMQEVAS